MIAGRLYLLAVIHEKMHDGLGDEVLDTLPDNVEIARNEAPNQIRLDSLSVGEWRFIINILHL